MEKSAIEWDDAKGVENLKKSGIVLSEQTERSGHFLTPEEQHEISKNLSGLLDRRIERTTHDCEERANKLRYAIQKLPSELDSLLTSFSSYLVEVGVSSVEVYVCGGFAREASGKLMDPNDGVNKRPAGTDIRTDTDIDVGVRCILKNGVGMKTTKSDAFMKFSPLNAKWRENDIHYAVDFAFFVADSINNDLNPDRPSVLLFQRDLHSV